MAPEFWQFYAKLDIPTNLEKLLTPMFFGLVGILENSAFLSVEKPIILKKYQALKVKNVVFACFWLSDPSLAVC